jgi:hypothetical protein
MRHIAAAALADELDVRFNIHLLDSRETRLLRAKADVGPLFARLGKQWFEPRILANEPKILSPAIRAPHMARLLDDQVH